MLTFARVLTIGLLLAASLAGCGANPAPPPLLRANRAPSVLAQPPATYEAVGVAQPVKQTQAATYHQATATGKAQGPAALTAKVVSSRNGALLGLGAFKARIVVTNPSASRLSGELVVTFQNNGKAASGPAVRQPVTLDPGQAETLEFSDRRWSTDGVEAAFADPEATSTTR